MKNLLIFTALILGCVGSAYAGSDVTAFDSIWAEISVWAINAPGKILAFLTFGGAVFLGVVKQNWLGAFGAFMGAMLIAQAESVITYFLDAGLPLVM